MIYLNHAAISPTSFRVREAVNKYLERRSLKDIECYPWAPKLVNETKRLIADIIHTTSDRIAFTLNTAEGLNILADGLEWNQGDRILLYRYEYPSNVYPFLNQARKGVVIDFYDPKDHRITLDVIKEHVKPETKLVSLSSVQFSTGYRADLEAIGKFCKENNIVFSVDGIQSVPYRSLDVTKCKIDFLSVGSHKWMMGTEGVAFIYVSERVQKLIHQSAMGWTSVKDVFDHFNFDTNRLRDDAGRYENGTLNYFGIVGMNAALKFFAEFGFAEMEKNTLALSGIIIDMLEKRGVEVVTPKNETERAGIVSAYIDNAEEVVKKLLQKNIIVAFRAGRIRFAPYFYNTEEEVRKAVNAVFD